MATGVISGRGEVRDGRRECGTRCVKKEMKANERMVSGGEKSGP